ncbi:unnamed protein product [Cyprideis torosa]|uniref:Uncharacterized protein n=1 Tax=Cyprideis torosa TaxID=163714 RepID=A0A7R8ZHN0_9CRUS|nr:unnamed protein product [Cyprideis torosa]CAG0884114.1 unnamed protein product [Cyprideis torosa]
MPKAPAIGIDLGTTYSCVGVFLNGKVHIIQNDHGNRATPSCVGFEGEERFVGEEALEQIAINPENVIFDAKRLIGLRFDDPAVQSDMKHWPFCVVSNEERPKVQVILKGEQKTTFFPEEISSMVLQKMKETAEDYIGQTVQDAVITVPAYFRDSQRQATKEAGAMAGLNVIRIINEPTAAALAYGFDRKVKLLCCIDFITKLTRGLFEKLCDSFFRSSLEYVSQSLRDANLDKSSIHDVILVGGSTRIPKIQELLSDFFDGKKIKKTINPDEAVAYGAALQAAILNGDLKNDVVLRDVTPFSLGIGTWNNGHVMFFVVKKNSRIPLKETKEFFTLEDNQTFARFRVYEGESAVATDNDLLGEFKLTDVPPKPKGEAEFDVTFDIDEDGILKVTAVSRDTGHSKNIIITKSACANRQRFL